MPVAAAGRWRYALLAAVLIGSGVRVAPAKVFLPLDEALALAFPGATIERVTVYLTAAQVEAIRIASGQPPESALVVRYLATRGGERLGSAYLDTHRVRTLPETLLVIVTAAGSVARVEVLSFAEPEEYRPRDAWYRQFEGRVLDGDLAVKRGIRPVTGATLTAAATTAAVRRVLALHRVLEGGGDP